MYWEYTLVEYLGFIIALCSLPLLGFLAGRQHTITRLNSERDREAEVRSIYQDIEQLQDNNPRTTT